jgi:hypothetical protein
MTIIISPHQLYLFERVANSELAEAVGPGGTTYLLLIVIIGLVLFVHRQK